MYSLSLVFCVLPAVDAGEFFQEQKASSALHCVQQTCPESLSWWLRLLTDPGGLETNLSEARLVYAHLALFSEASLTLHFLC